MRAVVSEDGSPARWGNSFNGRQDDERGSEAFVLTNHRTLLRLPNKPPTSRPAKCYGHSNICAVE